MCRPMKRSDRLSIRIAPEIKERLEAHAAARGETLSVYILTMLNALATSEENPISTLERRVAELEQAQDRFRNAAFGAPPARE